MYSEYLEFVEEEFYKCFSEKGYIQEEAVKITSKVDSSVTFIGSAISPMKKYVLSKAIGKSGRFIIQNSIRTRALKNILNSEYSMFGSYFKALGVLIEYRDLERLVLDTFDYLINYLKISYEDIIIRINSKDNDLLDAVKKVDSKIVREYDAFEEKYYKHKYGLEAEKITGRNFNIGIRKKGTEMFLDIGNIIVMENEDEKLAVELALGNCTISMSYFGVDSTVASSKISDVFEINTVEKMKFADAIIATAVLMYEDIRKMKAHRWFEYHFRKYCRAIAFWKDKLNVQYETIAQYMRKFLKLEYNDDIKLSDEEIINYIKA